MEAAALSPLIPASSPTHINDPGQVAIYPIRYITNCIDRALGHGIKLPIFEK